jgi:hypothetical protein
MNGREFDREAEPTISFPSQASARFDGIPGGVSPIYQINGTSRYLTL